MIANFCCRSPENCGARRIPHKMFTRHKKCLPDSHNIHQTQATSTALRQPQPDSPNIYQTHPNSTRFTQPWSDSTNLYQTHLTSTRLTQPIPDFPTSTILTKLLPYLMSLMSLMGLQRILNFPDCLKIKIVSLKYNPRVSTSKFHSPSIISSVPRNVMSLRPDWSFQYIVLKYYPKALIFNCHGN